MENNQETFQYTYSPEQRAEIEKIRSKYLPNREDKMEQLRRLDRSAGSKAQVWALCLGVVGALILGAGMSLCMTDLGADLGGLAMVLGIAAGIVGLVLTALAYPVYNRILTKERKRIAPLILKLADELTEDQA